jgi:hypothetical protein
MEKYFPRLAMPPNGLYKNEFKLHDDLDDNIYTAVTHWEFYIHFNTLDF